MVNKNGSKAGKGKQTYLRSQSWDISGSASGREQEHPWSRYSGYLAITMKGVDGGRTGGGRKKGTLDTALSRLNFPGRLVRLVRLARESHSGDQPGSGIT